MTTPRERGLGAAVEIQKRHPEPADWKAALEQIADPEERQVAREYLRAVWLRTETIKRLRAAEGTRAAIIPPACEPPDHAT